MAHICREWMNSTTTIMYPLICQALLSAGWVEHYTISSDSRVFKSNGKDDNQPPIYLHFYKQSNDIYGYYYQHWSGAAGVCSVNSNFTIASTTVSIRMFVNKHYLIIVPSPFNSYSTLTFWPISPLRLVQVVQHSITGGSSVTLTVPSISGFRLNEYKVIYGIAGEGQQEIRITNVDTNLNTITVTGCSNNYASGALVGDYISSFISLYSGNLCQGFPWSRNGLTQPNVYTSLYGKNNNVGDVYAHENYVHLDVAIAADSNRYIGEIDSTYIKTAKSTTPNDLIQVINNDALIVDSLVTSYSNYVLTDTTKNWTPGALIGKVCVFISGTGSGLTRYIIDNTSNTITFRTDVTIDTTTGFRIADEAYRVVNQSGVPLAVREEI